jgi:hypothetical protein
MMVERYVFRPLISFWSSMLITCGIYVRFSFSTYLIFFLHLFLYFANYKWVINNILCFSNCSSFIIPFVTISSFLGKIIIFPFFQSLLFFGDYHNLFQLLPSLFESGGNIAVSKLIYLFDFLYSNKNIVAN